MQAERLAMLFVEAADTVEISQYRQIGESLLGRADLSEIIAFLLRSHFSQTAMPRSSPPSSESRHRNERERPAKPERSQVTPPAPMPMPMPTPSATPARKIEPRATPLPRKPEPVEAEESALEEDFSSEPNPDQTRIYVTLGRDDGFSELSELALYMADTSGVDFGFFTGMGQLRDSSSHVEVESDYADKIIACFNDKDRDMTRAKGANAANLKILCEKAKGAEIKPKRRYFKRPR
jgi:hypothetical protein